MAFSLKKIFNIKKSKGHKIAAPFLLGDRTWLVIVLTALMGVVVVFMWSYYVFLRVERGEFIVSPIILEAQPVENRVDWQRVSEIIEFSNKKQIFRQELLGFDPAEDTLYLANTLPDGIDLRLERGETIHFYEEPSEDTENTSNTTPGPEDTSSTPPSPSTNSPNLAS